MHSPQKLTLIYIAQYGYHPIESY